MIVYRSGYNILKSDSPHNMNFFLSNLCDWGVQIASRNDFAESPWIAFGSARGEAGLLFRTRLPTKPWTSMDHVNPGIWLFSPRMSCQFQTHYVPNILNMSSIACIKLFKWCECDTTQIQGLLTPFTFMSIPYYFPHWFLLYISLFFPCSQLAMFYMSEFLHKPSFQWHPYGLGVVNGVREGVAVRAGVIGLLPWRGWCSRCSTGCSPRCFPVVSEV